MAGPHLTNYAPLAEVTLAIGVYGDGYTLRGRPNVNMKFALIYQTGGLSPYLPNSWDLPCSTPMLTWRKLPQRDFEMWVP